MSADEPNREKADSLSWTPCKEYDSETHTENPKLMEKSMVNHLKRTILFGFTLQSHLEDAHRNYTDHGPDHNYVQNKRHCLPIAKYGVDDQLYTLTDSNDVLGTFALIQQCSNDSPVSCTPNQLSPEMILQEALNYELTPAPQQSRYPQQSHCPPDRLIPTVNIKSGSVFFFVKGAV